MQTIYLSGPIADCTNEECKDWREFVKTSLDGRYLFLDPMVRDFRHVNTIGREAEIVDKDKGDIDKSDVIFAYTPKVSVGTTMEIFYAFTKPNSIPVIVVCPLENPSPWLKYHTDFFFTDLQQGVDLLMKHDKIKFN